MRKYPRYKTTGVGWLEKMPEHWVVGKVRRVLDVLTDFTANGSFADLAKNVKYLDTPDYSRLIRLTDLREDLKNEGIYVSKEAHEYLSKSELFGGEILMANVGAYAGFVCLVPVIDFKATLGPNMFLLKFDQKRLTNLYAYTLLSSDCYYRLLMNKALSSAQPKLNKEDVKSIDFIFPPKREEQLSIVLFLDHKTGQIDRFIANRQKQIELLKEQKAAIINKAVTKGINPNAKMKDSGIEWIDQVPRHWKKLRLKNLTTRITNGFVGSTSNILRESGVRYIQALHVKQNTIIFNVPYFVGEEWSKGHPRSILREGDIVITQTGAMTGDVGLVPKEFEGCNCHALIIVKPDQRKVIPAYLLNLLASKFGNSLLESIRTGSMHPHLNSTIVCDINLSIPEELKEQQAILDFINAEISDIDVLISKYQKQIDLMQEYRTSLISQAVTGKIDVRDWQPKAREYKTDDWPLSAAAEK